MIPLCPQSVAVSLHDLFVPRDKAKQMVIDINLTQTPRTLGRFKENAAITLGNRPSHMNHPPILVDISELKTCNLAMSDPGQYRKMKKERVCTDG